MSLYTLNIRIGKDFYPVNYDYGTVCWDESRRPTLFDKAACTRITLELLEGGMLSKDFQFREADDILYIPPRDQAQRLRLVKRPHTGLLPTEPPPGHFAKKSDIQIDLKGTSFYVDKKTQED